jgi:NADH:ubiquinone oxidoreductase subunit F (NADH-binding)
MAPFLLPSAPVTSLDEYLATETGGLGVQRANEIGPAAVIDEVLRSGLRGRGGGGFPTGRKWAGVAGQDGGEHYVVANGAEGEPATYKDRALMRANPYQLVEGVVIAGFAVGARQTYIAMKASFEAEREAVTRAAAEMQEAGICRDCEIVIVGGPDEYLFGEEKALLEVIEGRAPMPRLLPPHEHGLFASAANLGWESSGGDPEHGTSNPTVVNNAETLSNVPHILAKGADWFRTMGTRGSPGTVVATVVGDVVAPDVGEVELGTTLRDVIDHVGSGLGAGRTVKAVFSGVANPVITAAHLDTPLDHDAFHAIGSGLGAAGFAVYDDTACMVEVARQFSRFLAVESCGQCPPCKLGSAEITARLERVEAGIATDEDVDDIGLWLGRVTDGNRCYLAVEEQQVVASVLTSFAEEVTEHLETGACPRPRHIPLPLISSLGGGRVTYDERHYRKRSDWTYA